MLCAAVFLFLADYDPCLHVPIHLGICSYSPKRIIQCICLYISMHIITPCPATKNETKIEKVSVLWVCHLHTCSYQSYHMVLEYVPLCFYALDFLKMLFGYLLNRPRSHDVGNHQACLSKLNPPPMPVGCHKQVSATAQWIVCMVCKAKFQEVLVCHPSSFDSGWIWVCVVNAAQCVWVGGWSNTLDPLWHTLGLGTMLLQRWLLWHNVLDTA